MDDFGAPMRHLALDRPLAVFDLETTGIDPARDRIVEIAILRVEPGGGVRTLSSLVDPEMPIPPEASAIHGITDLAVRGQPTLGALAPEILRQFEGADLGGYNTIKFDLPLLAADLARAGFPFDTGGRRHVDAMRIFHEMERRDLAAALRFYCGQELEQAHSALADASATLAILDAQLARYPHLPRELDGLHRLCNPDEGRFVDATRKLEWAAGGEVALAFGKHRGRTLRELAVRERSYLEWIAGSDFTPEVKAIVADALRGVFPGKPG